MLEGNAPQGVGQSPKSRKTSHKRTIEALEANSTKECLKTVDSANKGLTGTLNMVKPNATKELEQICCHSESFSGERDSMKFDSTSDEDVSKWLDEDPVSDLELSFVADEVENRS